MRPEIPCVCHGKLGARRQGHGNRGQHCHGREVLQNVEREGFIVLGRMATLFVITTRVMSVGLERVKVCRPITPEAPGTFSTTTVMPSAVDRPGCSKRAVASVAPPALVGTMSRTRRSG